MHFLNFKNDSTHQNKLIKYRKFMHFINFKNDSTHQNKLIK